MFSQSSGRSHNKQHPAPLHNLHDFLRLMGDVFALGDFSITSEFELLNDLLSFCTIFDNMLNWK